MNNDTKKVYHYLYNIKMFDTRETICVGQVEKLDNINVEVVIENLIEKVEDKLYDILKKYLEKFDNPFTVNKQTIFMFLIHDMEAKIENHSMTELICRFYVQQCLRKYIEIHISMDGCITKVEEKLRK